MLRDSESVLFAVDLCFILLLSVWWGFSEAESLMTGQR